MDPNKGNRAEEEEISNYPAGDIFHKYQSDDSKEKFDYLKAKYIFRFPFTITAIKWGLALGGFFAIHSYVKRRKRTI